MTGKFPFFNGNSIDKLARLGAGKAGTSSRIGGVSTVMFDYKRVKLLDDG